MYQRSLQPFALELPVSEVIAVHNKSLKTGGAARQAGSSYATQTNNLNITALQENPYEEV